MDGLRLHATGQDNAVEGLAGSADKRLPFRIFVRARSLADKTQFRIDLANAKYGLRPRRSQFWAARASQDAVTQYLEGLASFFHSDHRTTLVIVTRIGCCRLDEIAKQRSRRARFLLCAGRRRRGYPLYPRGPQTLRVLD